MVFDNFTLGVEMSRIEQSYQPSLPPKHKAKLSNTTVPLTTLEHANTCIFLRDMVSSEYKNFGGFIMKKLVTLVLAMSMCLAVLSFTACYDDSVLKEEIRQLKEQNGVLQQQLDNATQANGIKGDKGDKGDPGEKGEKGDPGAGSGNVDELPIYQLGETATIYFNGVRMFSITYTEKATTTAQGTFNFTNHGLSRCLTTDLIDARRQDSTNPSSIPAPGTIISTYITSESVDIVLCRPAIQSDRDMIYFYSPGNQLTYAVFKL
ncbi:MAG: hypothetical protein FWD58_11060 [Firmicutes bacterium]|nr:hypothetical protein [Bacillota bacterium]